jgi:hypothetical protein
VGGLCEIFLRIYGLPLAIFFHEYVSENAAMRASCAGNVYNSVRDSGVTIDAYGQAFEPAPFLG